LPLQTQLKIWHPNSSVGLSKHRKFTIDQAMLNKPEITLMINIDNPEPRNSFEELNLHEH